MREIYIFIGTAAIFHFGAVAGLFSERKERAKYNPIFDERIKSYEHALDDLKRGKYSRPEHEESKRSAREFYDRYLAKSKPFDFAEYPNLQKHYEREIKGLRASRKKEMGLLEWIVCGPEVMLVGGMFPIKHDSLQDGVPMKYVSSELREDDLVRLRRASDFARFDMDINRLNADHKLKGTNALTAEK